MNINQKNIQQNYPTNINTMPYKTPTYVLCILNFVTQCKITYKSSNQS